MEKQRDLKIMVSAGEYSGDQHAAKLVEALNELNSKLNLYSSMYFKGMGGRCLRQQNVTTLVDSETSGSINGFNLIAIFSTAIGALWKMSCELFSWRPDLLILVDYPDFNLRLARVAKWLNIPVLYYIPPKVWAWRSGRVRTIKKRIDRTAVIFPFEKEFFETNGYGHASFVGHPFIDLYRNEEFLPSERTEIISSLGLDPNQPLVAVLAGSRQSEVARHLPVVLSSLKRLKESHPEIQAVFALAPAVNNSEITAMIEQFPWIKTSTGNSVEIMKVADCGLLKSGTCNLEAAFVNLPFVCFYKTSKISALIARIFLSIRTFSLVNIIRSNTVKELIQQDATTEKITNELESLLFNQDYISKIKAGFAEIRKKLSFFDPELKSEAGNTTVTRVAEIALQTAERRPSPFLVFRRILGFLRPYKLQFIAALGCMVLFGASDGIVPFLVKHILDGIFADQDKTMLTVLPIMLVAFTIFRALADFGQEFLISKVGLNIVRDIRKQVHAHLLELSAGFYIKHSSGSLLARFTSDVLLVKTFLTNSLASIIRDSIRVVALLIAAVYLDPILALISFVIFPLGLFPVYKFGRRMRRLSRKGQEAIGSLSSLIQETIVGNRVVKIFCREDYEKERFQAENEKLNNTFIKSERIRAVSGPVNEILGSFAISGVILYGGFSVISGVRSQGEFIAFLLSVFLLYDPFKKLSRVNSAVQQGASGAERIFELLDTAPEIVDPITPVNLPKSNAIDFENVYFSYNESGDWILEDIQLHVPEGGKFALVGHSGAGKTTLVDLIPRFIEPKKGKIKIGGMDISKVSLKDLRARITMVSQHTFLFNDSIYNNIAYGNPSTTEQQIVAASKAAHAYDFIMGLPDGFNTVVGQDGLSLSGGERQRISIARALLKDAPILILDEATASLDNRSEREVQAALEKLQENRTTIVIAHRLSTIRNADCIIVVDDGKIVEAGNHQELLDRGGPFARLYALQFAQEEAAPAQPLIN